MKKWYLFFLCFLTCWPALAQHQRITGHVTDAEGTPVPYCRISFQNGKEGSYSSEDGSFTLNVSIPEDTLLFTCVGYEQARVGVATGSFSVSLLHQPVELKEIAIIARKGKRTTGILFRKTRHEGNAFLGPGFETGLYFKPSAADEAYLKEIFLYISPLGLPQTRFRVHVYRKDTLGDFPGADITGSNLILHGSPEGGEWIKVDLSDKFIPVQDGIYITMEWVSGHGNSDEVQKFVSVDGSRAIDVRGKKTHRVNKRIRKYATENPLLFKGQVLGLTRNRQGKLVYSRQVFKNTGWYATPDPIIPMIYATYTYYK